MLPMAPLRKVLGFAEWRTSPLALTPGSGPAIKLSVSPGDILALKDSARLLFPSFGFIGGKKATPERLRFGGSRN